MDIGLRAINEKIDEKMKSKEPVDGKVKDGNMRAMLSMYKQAREAGT